jgi:replicative DNA helicase
MQQRKLPQNDDVEASILGGILVRSDLLVQLDTLEIDDFANLKHRVVFEAMRNLETRNQPIDVVTVEHEVERAGKLDALGGVAFLGEIALRVPTVDNVVAYARIVQDLSMARRLAFAASEIVERCYAPDVEPAELLGEALGRLAQIDRAKHDSMISVGELTRRRFVELDALATKRGAGELALTGAPTGIAALDRKIGGYQFGIINLIAGRPAMGKSAVAKAAARAGNDVGYGVHVFSMEDSRTTYADRLLAGESGVSAEKLRQANLEGKHDGVSDYARVGTAATSLGKRTNWEIDDRKGLSAIEIVRAVRKHKKRLGTRVVIVDYLHLVRRNPRLEEHQALDEIMTTFANHIEPDEAWLVLSQLNRKLEERNDKRPQYGDLRGSGAIEERSKIIIGLYRGVVYGGQPKREIDYDCDCNDQMIASRLCTHGLTHAEWASQLQAVVIKNNNGEAPCRVFASWRGETLEVW